MKSNWDLIKQREELRKKWLKAKEKGDLILMNLYERLGKKISALIKQND